MGDAENNSVQKALNSVAKREGVSVETVRREMEAAINAARQSDNPAVRALWESMCVETGGSLTAEDVVAHFAQMDIDEEEQKRAIN